MEFKNTITVEVPADRAHSAEAVYHGGVTATIGTSRSADYGLRLVFERVEDARALAEAILDAADEKGAAQ